MMRMRCDSVFHANTPSIAFENRYARKAFPMLKGLR
jgi:hypothetical protein